MCRGVVNMPTLYILDIIGSRAQYAEGAKLYSSKLQQSFVVFRICASHLKPAPEDISCGHLQDTFLLEVIFF